MLKVNAVLSDEGSVTTAWQLPVELIPTSMPPVPPSVWLPLGHDTVMDR